MSARAIDLDPEAAGFRPNPMPIAKFLRSPTAVVVLAAGGGLLWLGGIVLPILAWNRHNPTAYWPHNHFISELGFPGTSPLTWLFSVAEAVGSLLVVPVAFAVAALRRTRPAAIAAAWVTLALLSASAVGWLGLGVEFSRLPHITMAFLNLHVALALLCFAAWAVAVALFTVDLWPGRETDAAARGLVIAGVVGAVAALAFVGAGGQFLVGVVERHAHPEPALKVLLDSKATPGMFHDWLEYRRPDLVAIGTTEWVLLGAMFLWHGVAVIYLWRHRDRSRETAEPLPEECDPWRLTARWISIVAHPFSIFVVLLLLPLLLRGQWAALRVAVVVALAGMLPLGVFMWRRYRAGRWSTVDASDRRDRPVAFAALYVVLLPVLAYFQWVEHSPTLVRGGLIVGAMVAVAAAAHRWIKGSGHMAFATFGAVVLVYVVPVSAAVFALLLPALAWSRVHLRRHTRAEVLAGALLGLLAGWVGISR